MDESWLRLVWTFLVATSGVVIGQVVVKLAIEPAAHLQRLIADAGAVLLSRQHKIINESEHEDTADKLRALAGQLRAYAHLVPLLRLWRLPSKADVKDAAGLLNLLAYRVGPKGAERSEHGDTLETLKTLRKLLAIPTQYSDSADLRASDAIKKRA